MAGRYDNVNGTWCKVSKRYTNVGGTWDKVKKRYENVNGVWVPSYSSAVKWTIAIIEKSDGTFSSGYNTEYSGYLSYGGVKSTAFDWYVKVEYTFTEPITISVGQTVQTVLTGCGSISANSFVAIYLSASDAANHTNAVLICHDNPASGTYTYTASQNLTVYGILVMPACTSDSGANNFYSRMAVTVDCDVGSFLLNDAGSFEP